MKAIKEIGLVVAIALNAGSAFAQSNVRIYGILDTAVAYTKLSNGTSFSQMLQTGHVPTRLGFEGQEDLGGGLYAAFRMEQGFAVDTGALLQGGRGFGREAFVSLGSRSLGELRVGRQYAVMQVLLPKYDPDHVSPFSPVLAMQLSNLQQTSQDNLVKYVSPEIAGFSLTLTAAPGEGGVVAAGSSPEVVGAGIAKRSQAGLLEYRRGGLALGMAYQKAGETLNTGGSADQTMSGLGGNYNFGGFELGALIWRHRNVLPSGLAPTADGWTVGGSWEALPLLRLVAQFGKVSDNSRVYATGAVKAHGTDTYLNLGATYDLSKRTAIYTRVGRTEDENGGFNGRALRAAPTISANTPLANNLSVRGVAFGLRHRF